MISPCSNPDFYLSDFFSDFLLLFFKSWFKISVCFDYFFFLISASRCWYFSSSPKSSCSALILDFIYLAQLIQVLQSLLRAEKGRTLSSSDFSVRSYQFCDLSTLRIFSFRLSLFFSLLISVSSFINLSNQRGCAMQNFPSMNTVFQYTSGYSSTVISPIDLK